MATPSIADQQFQSCRGVSLIETLISALVVTIAVVGLLQFTGQVLAWYQANQAASAQTLELWNKGRDLRRSRPDSTDTVVPIPGARPLHRFVLRNRNGSEWEVICAEK